MAQTKHYWELSPEEKERSREAKRRYNKKHAARLAIKKKVKYAANKEEICKLNRSRYNYEKSRNRQLINNYGITLEDYNTMVAKQSGKCGICGVVEKLFVDHNHDTGEVRNLLCNNCNAGIAMFAENTSVLTTAIEYLKKWGR